MTLRRYFDLGPKRAAPASDWVQFKQSFAKQVGLTAAQQERIAPLTPAELYAAPGLPVPPQKIARQIADFMKLPYHQAILKNEIPLSIGGGIGQSRTLMQILGKAHLGEVSVTVWPKILKEMCAKKNIFVLD